jgi:hypothetical protein
MRNIERFVAYSVEAVLARPPVMACCDIPADFNSALFTGTHSDITATDQIRPIATTTAIPMHVRICHPLCVTLSLLPFLELVRPDIVAVGSRCMLRNPGPRPWVSHPLNPRGGVSFSERKDAERYRVSQSRRS